MTNKLAGHDAGTHTCRPRRLPYTQSHRAKKKKSVDEEGKQGKEEMANNLRRVRIRGRRKKEKNSPKLKKKKTNESTPDDS